MEVVMAIYSYIPYDDMDTAIIKNITDEFGIESMSKAHSITKFLAGFRVKNPSSYIDDYGFVHRVIDEHNDTLLAFLFEMENDDIAKPIKEIEEIITKKNPPMDLYDQFKNLETMLEGHEFDNE